MGTSPQPVRPTLLRRFTLLSLGTTIAIGIVFGTLTARLVQDFAFRRQARATAAHVGELVGSRLTLKDFLSAPPAGRAQFERAMQGVTGRAGIVHVVVWSRLGQVLYSDGPDAPGQPAPAAARLRAALTGELQWDLIAPAVPGDRSSAPRLDVLVPVMVQGVDYAVAAYQVVVDLTDLAPALARLRWSVELSVVLGVLILYAALFTIVRRASGDLERKESMLRRSFVGIIRSLVNALDARDMATAHHSSRVASGAVTIARAMGLSDEAVGEVQVAGFLHDVGKIGIRDDVLAKRGALTRDEQAMMQRHTAFGFDILEPVPIPDGVKLAVRHSHERWDGRGYPDRLAGDRIPLSARIIAVADAFEALTTDRPYRSAQHPQRAAEEISRCAGTQFDPAVVDAFVSVWQQIATDRDARAAS